MSVMGIDVMTTFGKRRMSLNLPFGTNEEKCGSDVKKQRRGKSKEEVVLVYHLDTDRTY